MRIRLLLFLSALLVIVNAAITDHPSNTKTVTNSASSLIQQIAHDIKALRPKFTELADFSPSKNSVTKIEYRRNADYVAKAAKRDSYYDVKPGGCRITVEAWDASSEGWPGMAGGPEVESINLTLTNGMRIMAHIQAPNAEFRKAVANVINARLETMK